VLDELSETYFDLVFFRLNVDDNPATPGKYGIRAIPTVIFFKKGKPVTQFTGMTAKVKIEEEIKKALVS